MHNKRIVKKSPNYRHNQSGSSMYDNAQTLESLCKRKSNAGRRPIDSLLMFK